MKRTIALFVTLLVSTAAFAQFDTLIQQLPPAVKDVPTVDTLMRWSTMLYTALFIIIGFISDYVPWLDRISNKSLRVFVAAAVAGTALAVLGVDAIDIVASYLLATLTYDKTIKPLKDAKKL